MNDNADITTWDECNDDGSLLLGQFTISTGGFACYMHVLAIEVKYEAMMQVGVNDQCEDELNKWASADEPDGSYDTLIINGRPYVLFASPHC